MQIDKKKISKLARSFKIKLMILFGSQANGETHKESDMDIAFYSTSKVDEEKLYNELIHMLKRADIDLINLMKAHNHYFRYEILHTGTVLYEEKTGIKSNMEWQSWTDYIDFKRYYDLRSKLLDKRLAKT